MTLNINQKMGAYNMHILLIDNYDSFTFNLVHLVLSIPNVKLTVRRNDDAFLEEIRKGDYDAAIIGPGPGSPEDHAYFGHNHTVITEYGTKGLPILGVCLGFQGIYHAFGGTLKKASLPMHGKISQLDIIDDTGKILHNLPQHLSVMRYHSLMADFDQPVPDCLNITAFTHKAESALRNGREAMVLEHKEHPIYGVQYHPESFATEYGRAMIQNFLRI